MKANEQISKENVQTLALTQADVSRITSTHPAASTFHNILHLARRWQTRPSIRWRGCRQGGEGGSWGRSNSITLCFSLQSRAARRLTHSLRDTLDNSQSGKCGWIPNENRSSLCFINCCCYQHFQIPHIPLTNRRPCRYLGGGERERNVRLPLRLCNSSFSL